MASMDDFLIKNKCPMLIRTGFGRPSQIKSLPKQQKGVHIRRIGVEIVDEDWCFSSGWWFQFFLFSSLFGEDSQVD